MAKNRDYFRFTPGKPVHLIELQLPETIDGMEFDHINESLLGTVNPKAGSTWVIDLEQVDYMGSAMLGLMINVRQQIKAASGKLVLCCLSQKLAEIFHTCSLERLFTITKTRAEAMKKLGK